MAAPANSKAKVLIVDDEDSLASSLVDILEFLGHEARAVNQPEKALDALNSDRSISMVLSDIRMPRMSGIDLLQEIRKRHPKLPVVLMTGFADLIDTQRAMDLGAKAFLPKPFSHEQLQAAVKTALESVPPAEEGSRENFCRIPVSDLAALRGMSCPVYYQFNNGKIMLVANSVEEVSASLVSRLKERGITGLYIKREAFMKYLDFVLPAVRQGAPKIPDIDTKRKLLSHANQVLMERIYKDEIRKDVFDQTTMFLDTVLDVATEGENIYMLIEAYRKHSDEGYVHTLACSLYALLVAKHFGWDNPKVLFRVGLASMLHDIGLKELPPDLPQKSRLEMSFEERKLFESHCTRGYEILCRVKEVPEVVAQAALQHHEDCLGYGFPSNLKLEQLGSMSRLISTIDTFVNYILSPEGAQVSLVQAVDTMKKEKKFALDPEFLNALERALRASGGGDGSAVANL